jgi:hypothetical protein
MKIFIPISSFLLAVTAYYLKGIQGGIHTVLVRLYTTDAVDDQLRSKLVALNDGLFFWAFIIALISTALAFFSIYYKFCYRIAGVILLVISVLSVLCSMIMI